VSECHRFDRIELRPAERQLLVEGRPAAIGARAFDVLLALIERRERLVTKNELLDLAWPGVVVEENNLQVQISTLRKLLGRQAIATVPGRGYRFTLAPDGTQPAPPTAAAPSVPSAPTEQAPPTSNLPGELPPLYGRDAEVAEVVQLLAQHRLVSIVGAGGIGKTRVGQAVAHQVRSRFEDGVWLIELASISDPARVAATVAQTFNMPVSDPAHAIEAAIDVLRGKHLLLLFDNCEHLLGAVSSLAAAIRRDAPTTTVLTTSQEPLRVPNEHVYRLGTLAVPLPNTTSSPQAAADYGAVALFTARAQAADPRFRVNASNVESVLDICRRLDGIALALELAAARVPLLGVEGLRARLDERFNVLTTGARTALPRHQTLRAALEWSHALLSDAERTVFRRLAVFVGGFTLEAAQQVASDDAMDAWQVLDHLGALVDKSLVTIDEGDPPRYRLLETGRAYAHERLAEAGETETIAHRHAKVFTAMFETSWAERWHARSAELFARYRPELDNLRAALDWSSRLAPDLGVALAGASAWLLWDCGLQAEGIAVCDRAISHLRSPTPPAFEARVLTELALVGYMVLPVDRASLALERAIVLYRGLKDRVGLYLALTRRAPFLGAIGDACQARRILAEAESLEDAAWTPRLRLQRVVALCMVLSFTGSVDEYQASQRERCRLARLAEDELDELLGLRHLVSADLMLGRLDAVIRDGRELAARFRRRGFSAHLWYLILDISMALALRGALDEAIVALREALPLLKHGAAMWYVLNLIALIALVRGREETAARLFGSAQAISERVGYQRLMGRQYRQEEVAKRLRHAFAPSVLTRLMQEGAEMSEAEAVALALNELEVPDD